jgi:LysM repeat protein
MATLYTVKPGDSLSIIARDVLGDMGLWPVIASQNKIQAPYIIRPGQTLTLPDVPRKVTDLPPRTIPKKPVPLPLPAVPPVAAATGFAALLRNPVFLVGAGIGILLLIQQMGKRR